MVDLPEPADAGATFEQLVALCEPVRRDLYFLVVDRGDWMSRGQAADALGLRHGLAAHHLDRLAEDGLLEVEYRRLTGRSGPGAGRPAKLYRRADRAYALTIPPRNPTLVGRLLAEAIAIAGDEATGVRRRVVDLARDAGRAAAGQVRVGTSGPDGRRALIEWLEAYGYAPRAADGDLSLANCPYEPLSDHIREVVCSMNLALVEGAVDGVGMAGATCSLRPPAPGACCVHVTPWPSVEER
jgi:predicted ArsR family transcriptional regulator